MKRIIITILITMFMGSASVNAAPVPSESIPCNATEEQIIVTERLVGHIFDKVIGGAGYAEAMAESNRILFDAWLNKDTDGYAYGELVTIVNNAIWQYRNLYLRPNFYAENEAKVKAIIADVIPKYKNGEIDYDKACFECRVKIYQTVNPSFNPDTEFVKDSCYQDVPAVDTSLFTIARKLLNKMK